MPPKELTAVFNRGKQKKPSSKRLSKKSKTVANAATIIEYIDRELAEGGRGSARD
jgi:hypothetical protein